MEATRKRKSPAIGDKEEKDPPRSRKGSRKISTQGWVSVLLTKESTELSVVARMAPLLKQTETLMINSSLQADDLDAQCRRIVNYATFCMKLAFDVRTFGVCGPQESFLVLSTGELSADTPYQMGCSWVSSPGLMAVTLMNTELVSVCGLRCVFDSTIEAACSHVMGSIFVVAVPSMNLLDAPHGKKISFVLEANGAALHEAPIKVDVRPLERAPSPMMSYSPTSYPLHFYSLLGSVPGVCRALMNQGESSPDTRGVHPAALALWRGNRTLFTLLLWACRGVSPQLVLNLVRVRMELDNSVVTGSEFAAARQDLLDSVLPTIDRASPVTLPSLRFSMQGITGGLPRVSREEQPGSRAHIDSTAIFRPNPSQDEYMRRGSLAFLLETQQVADAQEKKNDAEHERQRVQEQLVRAQQEKDNEPLRRGSLLVLLDAIAETRRSRM